MNFIVHIPSNLLPYFPRHLSRIANPGLGFPFNLALGVKFQSSPLSLDIWVCLALLACLFWSPMPIISTPAIVGCLSHSLLPLAAWPQFVCLFVVWAGPWPQLCAVVFAGAVDSNFLRLTQSCLSYVLLSVLPPVGILMS